MVWELPPPPRPWNYRIYGKLGVRSGLLHTYVKSFVAPIVAVVLGFGSVGTALAQATSTAPAQAPAAAPTTTQAPATQPAPAQKPAESKQKPMEAKAKKAHGMVKSASADSVVVTGKSKETKDAEWT